MTKKALLEKLDEIKRLVDDRYIYEGEDEADWMTHFEGMLNRIGEILNDKATERNRPAQKTESKTRKR
jgi:hypothetical protein